MKWALLLPAVLGCAVGSAAAQSYPSKPVTVIVPYAPGGATDLVARLTAQALSEDLGQSFIVENRAGGGGMIGVEAGARGAPDGYTLLFSSTGPATISPLLFKARDFDPVARLDPVIQVASTPAVLLARNGLPAASLDELIALSKKSPGSLNMASAGNGSLQHLIGELFQAKTGIKWQHVAYRGSAPAFNDLIGERVDTMVDVVPAAAPLIKGGKIRAIAVMVPKRSAQLPDVPTLDELGLKGFDFSGWHALFAPKGTPPEVIAKLNSSINKFLLKPENQAKLIAMGAVADGGGPERLAARVKQELQDWGEIIRSVGVTVNAD